MKTKLTLIMVPMLLGVSGAMAAEGDASLAYYGSLGVGGLSTHESSGTRDAAKLNEYRDMGNGLFGEFDIKGRSSSYYLDAFGENLGRDDQYLNLKGGQYTIFKYQLYDDRLNHNWTFGALTPYTGVGTDTLTSPLTFAVANTSGWTAYDLALERRDTGGMFEFSNSTPWYIRIDANEVVDDGLKLIAGSNGTSPGNGFIDKPLPIDTKTTNVAVEGGYSTKKEQVSVNVAYSKFSNNVDKLYWQNPYFDNTAPFLLDTTWLATDSDYMKIGINGALKDLPMGSTLAARLTYSKTENSLPIATTVLNTGAVNDATNPSATTFEGDIVHKTASLSWHLNPTRELDGRIYWNKFEKDNKSTHVTFTNLPTGLQCGRIVVGATVLDAGDCATETLSYKKNNLGVNAGYRFDQHNRVIFGYDAVDLKRDRVDYDETKDKTASVEYRNTSLDSLGVRVKLQRLERRSNFLEGDAGSTDVYGGSAANNPEYLNRYIARFDASNLDQNLFKLGLDARFADMFDLGFEYIVKKNNYKDTVLGRKDDDRNEIFLSLGYGDPGEFRVMAFVDLEVVKRASYHRSIGTVSSGAGSGINLYPSGYCQTTAPNCYDPFAAPTSSNYNWDASTKDKNWAFGVGADWFLSSRTKLSASITAENTDGHEEINVQPGANPATASIPISTYDDSQKTTLHLKGTYAVSKVWEFVGGYAYEKYHYSDISYDGYTNVIGTGTSASYLSGAYAFPDYIAQSVYLVGKYKF